MKRKQVLISLAVISKAYPFATAADGAAASASFKFSVIMPTYRRRHTIFRTIEEPLCRANADPRGGLRSGKL